MISFSAPVRIESEMNRRGSWRGRWARFRRQKHDVWLCFAAAHRLTSPVPLPAVVTLTRVAPRPITDSDNLASGFKAVRDQIAEQCGWNDGDPRITWRYEQAKGRPKEYAVRVEILSAPPKVAMPVRHR